MRGRFGCCAFGTGCGVDSALAAVLAPNSGFGVDGVVGDGVAEVLEVYAELVSFTQEGGVCVSIWVQ